MGGSKRSMRAKFTAALAGLALFLTACTHSGPPPIAPTGTTACGLTGFPTGTSGLCLDTRNAAAIPDGALSLLYQQADADAKLGGYVQFEPATLADDGSVVVALLSSDDAADDPALYRPKVGLLSSGGFDEFVRSHAASSPTDVVGLDRSGSEVAWLEQETDANGDGLGFAWSAWIGSGSRAAEIATQDDVDPGGLSLDTDDPGPAFLGDHLRWRLGVTDDLVDTEAEPAESAPQTWMANLDQASGKVTVGKSSERLGNMDSTGAHYSLTVDSTGTSFELSRASADGTVAVLARGTKAADLVLSDARVVDDAVVWLITPDQSATTPLGSDMPDNATEDSHSAMPVSPRSTASTTTPIGTQIFVYRTKANQLIKVQTTDAYLEPASIAVSAARIGWGGSDDPHQYLVDTSAGTIVTLGQCAGCGLVGLSPKSMVLYTRPSNLEGSQFTALVARLSDE